MWRRPLRPMAENAAVAPPLCTHLGGDRARASAKYAAIGGDRARLGGIVAHGWRRTSRRDALARRHGAHGTARPASHHEGAGRPAVQPEHARRHSRLLAMHGAAMACGPPVSRQPFAIRAARGSSLSGEAGAPPVTPASAPAASPAATR